MLKKLFFVLALSLPWTALAGNVNTYSYASGTVTTSSYTVLWASTPVSSSHVEICDSSGHLLKIATGPTGSEVDVAVVPVSSCVVLPLYIIKGTQLNIKAIDASASTGYDVVSVF